MFLDVQEVLEGLIREFSFSLKGRHEPSSFARAGNARIMQKRFEPKGLHLQYISHGKYGQAPRSSDQSNIV